MNPIQKAIIKTLCYSDIFDYPLTVDELWRYLVSKKPINKKYFYTTLKRDTSFFATKNKFVYLTLRGTIIQKRVQREIISEKKIQKTNMMIKWLSLIPTVQLIGVSGSVAVSNADESDDIDLFVITKAHTLWLTRFFLLMMLTLFGVRRKRKEHNEQDMFCINFLIDEQNLTFLPDKHDIYTAHEIVQMNPLFERNNTYQKFLLANKWVTKIMPNCLEKKLSKQKYPGRDELQRNTLLHVISFERLLRTLQLWYMRKHRTTEIVSDTFAAFHPIDYRGKIGELYKNRLKKFGLS